MMNEISKYLMIIGVIVFLIGLVMQFIPIGKLPGDIMIKKEHSTFYFPITTCIVISIVLSLFFYFVGKFR
jgi:heme/copper-type cytochrome/quinol oxidase subunit 2